MQNTNGIDGDTDINLSGESSAYFDNLECGNFQNTPGSYFTGVTSNIQSQIDGISGGLAGTYVTLGTTQTITGQKIFNSIPTTALTPSISTEFIPRGYADGRYGRLGSSNTWGHLNTFLHGIIPRRENGDGTDLQISNNAMVNRQTASTNNIGFGLSSLTGDTNPAGYIYNTGAKNIAIGNFALQKMDGGSSCIAIGYQSMQNVSQQRIYGAGIFPSRCVAIGENTLRSNLYGNDQVAIGHNSLTNVSSGNSNICIGTNAGNGLTFQSEAVVIGAGAAPSVNDNSITAIGASALGAATGAFNSGVAIGYQSFYNNNNASANTGVGAMSGLANTTGNSNTCIGCFAGRFNTSSNLSSTTTIGYASSAEANQEFVVGGNGVQGLIQYLTLPKKMRLGCNQDWGAGSTVIGLTFRSNENIILSANTIYAITLPSITGADNIGAKFNIYRAVQSTNQVDVFPASGQTLNYIRSDGAYVSILSGGAFSIGINDALTEVICVSTTKWMIVCRMVSDATNSVNITTNYTPGLDEYSVVFGKSNGTSSTAFSSLNNQAGFTYNTASSLLTTPNLKVTSTFEQNGTWINNGYRPYEIGAIVNNATVLPNSLSNIYYGLYTFQSGVANAVITLPTITVSMIGQVLTFRRIVNTSFSLIIKTAAGSGTTIINRNAITTTAANTNVTFLGTTFFYGQLVAISTTQWAILFSLP